MHGPTTQGAVETSITRRDPFQTPSSGSRHHIFWADGATHIGPPAEDWEAEQIEWVPLTDIRKLVEDGKIVSGTTVQRALIDGNTLVPPR